MEDKIYAKKSLGQNFLKSKKALLAMIGAGEISAEDIVLEIGPGQGVLTERILETGAKVIAVEKDDRLIEYLDKKFTIQGESGQFNLIHGDILEIDLSSLGLVTGKYKLIANIPYYITGLIFRKFLSGDVQPSKLVIMVQKEIADRIVARDEKESLLSLSVKAYGQVKKIMKVEKENFSPKPKVDSAILLVDNISKSFFDEITEEKFFEIIKTGFAHKRKMLIANLKEKFGLPAPRPGIFYVYAILCENDSIYIGQTGNLAKRWDEHRNGFGAEHTKRFGVCKIIHYEEFSSREEAVKREHDLKTGFGRKWLKRELVAGRTRQAGQNDLPKIFQDLKISEKARSEDLKLEDWKGIITRLIG